MIKLQWKLKDEKDKMKSLLRHFQNQNLKKNPKFLVK